MEKLPHRECDKVNLALLCKGQAGDISIGRSRNQKGGEGVRTAE